MSGALALLAVLSACYTSRTAILDEGNGVELGGIRSGIYCHAEIPPDGVLSADFTISAALGGNQCRDLAYDSQARRYVDARSPSMLFHVGDLGEALHLLQVRTGSTAPARYAPLAAVDGLAIQFDPAGEWPAALVAEAGLTLEEDGGLGEVDPVALRELLRATLGGVLADYRQDIAVAEGGAALRFADGVAIRYLVWVHEDLRGDEAGFAAALSALAKQLSLKG